MTTSTPNLTDTLADLESVSETLQDLVAAVLDLERKVIEPEELYALAHELRER